MRILLVTPSPPYPPLDGGSLFVHNLIKVLKRDHTLELLSLTEPQTVNQSPEILRQWFQEIYLVPSRRTHWQIVKRAASLLDPLPYWARVCWSQDLYRSLWFLARANKFDVIHLDTGLLAQYADAAAGTPRVISIRDAMSLVLSEHARISRSWWRHLFFRYQARKMRPYEKRWYPRFDKCHVVSRQDAQVLNRLSKDIDVTVISNGVDREYFHPEPTRSSSLSIGFIGRMDYPPNEDAVLFFAEFILPKIWKTLPLVRFYVVGCNPSSKIFHLAKDSRIQVTGFVPDICPWVARCDIMVSPIRTRGGVKNKVLEYLAMGKGAVVSPESLGGLNLEPDGQLLVAQGEADFAAKCIRLLLDEQERQRLGVCARRWTADHTWERTGQDMVGLYQEAIAKHGTHLQ